MPLPTHRETGLGITETVPLYAAGSRFSKAPITLPTDIQSLEPSQPTADIS